MVVEKSTEAMVAEPRHLSAVPRPRAARQRLTRDERRAKGKAARGALRRSEMDRWSEAADRRDPVEMLDEQAHGRLAELVPIRNGRMLTSPFAFFRGSAAIMAADLASMPSSGLVAQLCGDGHVSNFGGYASSDRQIVFDINDFDETLPGPWEWDVKRLCASLSVAGRHRGFDLDERRRLVRAAAEAYRTAMREFAALGNLEVWYSRLTAAGIIDRWGGQVDAKTRAAFERRMRKAMTKDSAGAASKLTRPVDGEQRFISDPPLMTPLADLLDGADRRAFERAVRSGLRAYGRSLAGDRRSLLEQYSFVDLARKVVGVGSVGTRAWVLLLRGVDADDHLMLQLKEARVSVLAPYAGRSRYTNQGQRVVEGQRLMQASSDIFLGWSRGPAVDGTTRDFYVRQLWDWKVSTDVEGTSVADLTIVAEMCGWTMARAHARSGDRVAIATYLGGSDTFDAAMARFAETYADRNERDYELFDAAATQGRVEVAPV